MCSNEDPTQPNKSFFLKITESGDRQPWVCVTALPLLWALKHGTISATSLTRASDVWNGDNYTYTIGVDMGDTTVVKDVPWDHLPGCKAWFILACCGVLGKLHTLSCLDAAIYKMCLLGKEFTCNAGECPVQFLGQNIPLEKGMATTPVS